MPGINVLQDKYFAELDDLAPDDNGYSFQYAGNTVNTLVDGNAYFGALRTEVNALKAPAGTGKFFYFSNWLLTLLDSAGGVVSAGSGVTSWDTAPVGPAKAFKLDDGSGAAFPDFIDELAEMAANGTDVRALVWVSPLMLSYQDAANRAGVVYSNNALSALSVYALRQKPGLANKACLNTLAHPLGSIHIKMVLCGDATGARAYISGIDFDRSRVDLDTHPAATGWHDAGIRIEGPATRGPTLRTARCGTSCSPTSRRLFASAIPGSTTMSKARPRCPIRRPSTRLAPAAPGSRSYAPCRR